MTINQNFALLGLMFAVDLASLRIAIRGNQIDHRDLADYYRKVAAGEEPEPARQAAVAGPAEQGPGLEADPGPRTGRQRQQSVAHCLSSRAGCAVGVS